MTKLEIITVIFFVLIMLGACGSEKKEAPKTRQEGWSDLKLSGLRDACVEGLFEEKGSARVTLEKSRDMCSCFVDALSYKYPYSDVEAFPDKTMQTVREESAKACAENAGLNWDDIEGVSLFQ